MTAKRQVRDFLARYHQADRPLLAGVSGGPDSLALYFVLKELQVGPLHIAHLDHGWRGTSSHEADQLEQLVGRDADFHRRRVDPPARGENWEDAAREQRLCFFRDLMDAHGCQAVLLAHHANDHAETVFKRVVDGASLSKLAGLRPIHRVRGIEIWRPLLSLPKSELARVLERYGVDPVLDPSNAGSLRGKLRARVFPFLEKELCRPLSAVLQRLGGSSEELADYLDSQTDRLLAQIVKEPLGLRLDVTQVREWHRVPLRHLIQRFCLIGGLVLSRDGLESACRLIQSGRVGKVGRSGRWLHIKRGHLFLP